MNVTWFLLYIGISPPDCFAGFCGGVVYAIVSKRTSPGGLLGAVVLGALTANYCGVLVGVYFPGAGAHFGAFLTGFGGVFILRQLLRKLNVDFIADGPKEETRQ